MEYKKWECIVCDGYMMKRKDIPEDGIESGTRWEDIRGLVLSLNVA